MEKLEKTQHPGIYYKPDTQSYVVTLDFGREKTLDKKTGQYKIRQKKKRKTAKTLKEALKIKREHESHKNEGTLQGSVSKVTLFKACNDYVNFNEISKKWTIAYLERQKVHVRRIEAYLLDNNMIEIPIKDISTLDIENLFIWSLSEHTVYVPENEKYIEKTFSMVQHTTLEKLKSFLKMVFRFCLKDFNKYGVKLNVADLADLPTKKIIFQPTIISIEQLNSLIRYALDYEIKRQVGAPLTILVLAALCGLRHGEICGLKWKDIIEEEGKPRRIHVLRQRQTVKGKEIIKVPKNGNDEGITPRDRKERFTSCSDTAFALLNIIKKEQNKYITVHPDDFVYQEPASMLVKKLPPPRHMNRRFNEFLTRYKKFTGNTLPDFRIHDLRHFFSQLLKDSQKTDLFAIAYCMGHEISGGNITTKFYLHDDGIYGRDIINQIIDESIVTDLKRHDYYNI